MPDLPLWARYQLENREYNHDSLEKTISDMKRLRIGLVNHRIDGDRVFDILSDAIFALEAFEKQGKSVESDGFGVEYF